MARRIAYQEHSPLVGPDGDPQGWRTLEPVTVVGSVFNTRTVRVQYTVRPSVEHSCEGAR